MLYNINLLSSLIFLSFQSIFGQIQFAIRQENSTKHFMSNWLWKKCQWTFLWSGHNGCNSNKYPNNPPIEIFREEILKPEDVVGADDAELFIFVLCLKFLFEWAIHYPIKPEL
uniref:Uncharacterized protein n=1 Tax=Ditylenchus dipsaci TaxID=166011 RepID=A0A915ET43_9BILA